RASSLNLRLPVSTVHEHQTHKGLVTTVINGDDTISTLSLGFIRDLRYVAQHLLDPENKGLAEKIIGKALGLSVGSKPVPTSGAPTPSSSSSTSLILSSHAHDEEWFWGLISHLRTSMTSEKLYPPGTVYWISSHSTITTASPNGPVPSPVHGGDDSQRRAAEMGGAGPITTTTTRASMYKCEDVREMCSEPRFSSRMMTDHFPDAYEETVE
ncbi:hypothetical protein HK102_012172, partial [Quaeritorhiza haematococci]